MTPAQTTALVEVTQGDREAMVAYERLSPVPLAPKFADEILAGKHDAMARIQLIARHRLAALEEAARVAEGWPVEVGGHQYQTSGNGSFWDEGNPYDQGRADAAASIRSLKEPRS